MTMATEEEHVREPREQRSDEESPVSEEEKEEETKFVEWDPMATWDFWSWVGWYMLGLGTNAKSRRRWKCNNRGARTGTAQEPQTQGRQGPQTKSQKNRPR